MAKLDTSALNAAASKAVAKFTKETAGRAAKLKKVKVSERALVARLNRKLASENEMIRKDRRSGEYMVIDVEINGVLHHDIDLEKFARKSGILQQWEELEGGN